MKVLWVRMKSLPILIFIIAGIILLHTTISVFWIYWKLTDPPKLSTTNNNAYSPPHSPFQYQRKQLIAIRNHSEDGNGFIKTKDKWFNEQKNQRQHEQQQQQQQLHSSSVSLSLPTLSLNWAIPTDQYQIKYNEDIWEQCTSQQMPYWMKQYFRWHKEMKHEMVSALNISSTSSSGKTRNIRQKVPCNVLYVTCLAEEFVKCGGTADRLLSLPFLVLVAARSNRLLLIEWTKPARLQEFLIPPSVGGVDWTVSESIQMWLNTNEDDSEIITARFSNGKIVNNNNNSNEKEMDKSTTFIHRTAVEDDIVSSSMSVQIPVVQVKFQSHDHGSVFYDNNRYTYNKYSALSQQEKEFIDIDYEPTFDHVFAAVWNCFFVPVDRIKDQIITILRWNKIRPGQYTGAHVRALYNVKTRSNELVYKWTVNSINCAHYLYEQNVTTVLPPQPSSSLSLGPNRNQNHNNFQSASTRDSPIAIPSNIYFASDSLYARDQAVGYGTSRGIHVITTANASNPNPNTTTTNADPLHLDKAKNWKSRPIVEYDPIFIDLYLLGMSSCVTYGMGGYGKLASLMRISSSSANAFLFKANLPLRAEVDNNNDALVDLSSSSSSSSSSSQVLQLRTPPPGSITTSNDICSMIHMTATSVLNCPAANYGRLVSS